jgi:hypothetical protein
MVLEPHADDAPAMASLVFPEVSHASDNAHSEGAPAVVHPLDVSRAGQRVATVAVSLSRSLGWRLVVVDGGSHGLDLEMVAAGAADARAGLIVMSVTAAHARVLGDLTSCPVVVAGTGEEVQRVAQGPMLCFLDPTPDAAHIAWTATRFALELGVTLQLVHIAPGAAPIDFPAIVEDAGATLLAVGADSSSALIDLVLGSADVPAMLIPAGLARRHGLRATYASDAREPVRPWRPAAVRDWRPAALGH